MNLKTTVATAACLAFAGAASAQLTAIGPFTGDYSEDFSGPQVIFTPCVSDAGLIIFDGNGDLCTPGASGCHTTGSWGFACGIPARSGPLFFGSAGGFAEYSFSIPVTQFGGYFGTNAPGSAAGEAIFYDASGAEIGSMPIDTGNVEDCSWNWNGWSSDVAIARVAVHNDVFGGAFLDMDDMEISAGSSCPADCDGDGALNTLDFLCFLNAFNNGDPFADYNGDGQINTLDFLAYLNDFSSGCE